MGIWAFTRNGSAASTCADSPFTWTVALKSPLPKIEINPPGATAGVKLAAFSTPAAVKPSASGETVHCGLVPVIANDVVPEPLRAMISAGVGRPVKVPVKVPCAAISSS